jgi:hypothetical protein
MSKKYLATGFMISCLCSLHSLHAGYSVISDLKRQIHDLQAQVDQLSQQTALDQRGAELPSGQPSIEKDRGWKLELGAVYFKTKLGGTDFAYRDNHQVGSYPIDATILEVSFPMNLGYTFSVERLFQHDNFTLSLDYLYYGYKGSNNASSRYGVTLIPLKGMTIIDEGVTNAKAQANVQYNDLGLTLHKSYFPTSSFVYEPYAGIKTSWIGLEQTSRYSGGPELALNTLEVRDHSRFFGIGIDIGNRGKWYFNKKLALSAFLDLALEYGSFDISYNEERLDRPEDQIALRQQKHQFIPIIDIGVDLSYGFYWDDKEGYALVSIGYESLFFLNQNQLLQVFNAYGSRMQNIGADLSFHGLVGKVSYAF